MNSLYFQNDEKYFQQINGLPMNGDIARSPYLPDNSEKIKKKTLK